MTAPHAAADAITRAPGGQSHIPARKIGRLWTPFTGSLKLDLVEATLSRSSRRERFMSRRKIGVVVAACAAVLPLVFASASATSPSQASAIYFGMDAPLTGPTQLVGQSDRQAVEAVVAYWNSRGGIRGRRVVVDVLDNASNPSQAVQNVQKFISDPKYVGIFGSGNAAAAVATGAIASQAGIPFIALSPPTTLVEPPQPYAYILTATARLYAYSEAAYLKSVGVKRVWLMGDNGGYGRDGPAQVSKLAKKYGLEIVDTTIFSPTSTDFSAELTRIKNSNAQALWLWTATPAGPTIVKQFKQLQLPQRLVLTGANVSPQFLQGTCGDVNGAIVNSFLATAWTFLPKTNPVRKEAALLRSILKRPVSNFDGDAAGALWAYKAAIERGAATRAGINGALETKLRGLVTPAGRIYPSRTNHQGLQLDSMWVGRIENCQVRPLFGPAFTKKK
jgi:branched-chain amino acid transport system substrate-binding protein